VKPDLHAKVLREWHPGAGGPGVLLGKPAHAMPRLVPSVMKSLGLEERLQQSQVFYQWEKIVGPEIARHAQPVALKKRMLIVTVDQPVWLNELSRYHKPLILQKVQQAIGAKAVADIRFRIG
jgi:predicted nucleic acid-binding Zn ribbon protein